MRRRYHYGPAGLAYIVITALLGIGAVNSQNNLLFLAFGIAAAAGIVSGVVSGRMMMGLRVERSSPGTARVGLPLTLRYTVRNTGRLLPAFGLLIEEGPAREGAGRLSRGRGAVLHLAPGATVEVPVVLEALRRGPVQLSSVVVHSAFPFGIVRKSTSAAQPASLLVLPRVERLRREATGNLLSRADAGSVTTSLRGRGDEFYGVREYVPGDSPRLISWRATARSGRLVVREQTTPAAGTLVVVLNLNAPASAPGVPPEDDAVERAIVLCASLLDAALTSGMDAGLTAPEEGVAIPPGSGSRQRQALMGALALLEPGGSRRGAEHAQRIPPRAACIVVHAGSVDPTVGPAGARHLTSSDLERVALREGHPAATDAGEGAAR